MCTYLNIENDVAQNLIDVFFLILTVTGTFHRKVLKFKSIWGYGVNFWKNGSFVSRA